MRWSIIAAAVLVLFMTDAGFARSTQTSSASHQSTAFRKIHSARSVPVQKHALTGLASFYQLRGRTASGQPLDGNGLTAAHPTLPFNTRVRVTCVETGKSVVFRIYSGRGV
jgi:rare lipoprotein A